MSTRQSGLLAHITSLPSPYGIGDLGSGAYDFADHLAATNQQLWQILPLGPTGPSGSPYSSRSTFAGNPLLISPEPLLEQGLLTPSDVAPLKALPTDQVDMPAVHTHKRAALTTAFERFEQNATPTQRAAVDQFSQRAADWLDDYTLYMALRTAHNDAPWTEWPAPLARYEAEAIAQARTEHATARRKHTFWQFLFHRQWQALHTYCTRRNIQLFGDLPIYVAPDSADVWANQELFQLHPDGSPKAVAGVPPDYFSPEGQTWGNPLYRWDDMAKTDYAWWQRRLSHLLDRVDLARIDHFRAFDAYWVVPADANTAVDGHWADGPGKNFFDTIRDALGPLPLVAEDLGDITDSVLELRDTVGLPGMAVLQFAFETDAHNNFLPHNVARNMVMYTGTHDNNTLQGWWNDDTTPGERERAHTYLDLERAPSLPYAAQRMLLASAIDRVVFPVQDIVGLGSEARMNTPGTETGNWSWRMSSDLLDDPAFERLATWTKAYGRTPAPEPVDDASSDAAPDSESKSDAAPGSDTNSTA